ncbi:MAG: hypothetical protein ACYTBZ_26995, partial [Planctomycetota bacterium]
TLYYHNNNWQVLAETEANWDARNFYVHGRQTKASVSARNMVLHANRPAPCCLACSFGQIAKFLEFSCGKWYNNGLSSIGDTA